MIAIKLDENFPSSTVALFTSNGIDASSVLLQNISGYRDEMLFNICKEEQRVIVTFDLDFANIIRYPADSTAGIVVCRVRKQINYADIETVCHSVIHLLQSYELKGCLAVIDGNNIRIRRPSQD